MAKNALTYKSPLQNLLKQKEFFSLESTKKKLSSASFRTIGNNQDRKRNQLLENISPWSRQ